jgi:DNA-binding CsgD family transcriptional regulator
MRGRTVRAADQVLAAVDAAYLLDAPDETWLQGILKAVVPGMDHGLGVVGFLYQSQDGHAVARSVVGHETLPAILRRLPVEIASQTPQEVATTLDSGHWATTASERIRSIYPGMKEMERVMPPGVHDSLVLNARSGNDGACFAAFLPRPQTCRPDFRARWSRVAIHVAQAARLRRRLEASPAEAILSPNGHLEHAETSTPAPHLRQYLTQAVQLRERARGPLRHREPDEALELWRGLVQGRWSLVDHIDSDGRRFILARRNEPEVPGLRESLTQREQQVIARAALGESNKLIGYQLGLSASTVAFHLSSASQKLGVETRDALRAWLPAEGVKQ